MKSVTQDIQGFLDYLEFGRSFSPQTLKAYRHDLGKFMDFLPAEKRLDLRMVTKDDIRGFLEQMATFGHSRPNTPITRARKLASIKSLFKYLVNENLISKNPSTAVEAPKIPHKEPSYLTENEYLHLLNTIKKVGTPYYLARDVAVVTTFLATGIRLSELVGLNLQDVDLKERRMKVLGKGNKERIIPLNESVVVALDKYLSNRPLNDSTHLFTSRLGNRLSKGGVYHLIKTYLRASRISKDKIGVHSLRHSFGASLLNQGVNLVVIQELLGHKKLETTRRYLHVNGVDLRNAVEQIAF